MLAAAVLLWIVERLAGRRAESRSGLADILPCIFMLGLIVVWYTMRGAGVMDYKCTVAVNLFWLAASLAGWRQGSADGMPGEVGEQRC